MHLAHFLVESTTTDCNLFNKFFFLISHPDYLARSVHWSSLSPLRRLQILQKSWFSPGSSKLSWFSLGGGPKWGWLSLGGGSKLWRTFHH